MSWPSISMTCQSNERYLSARGSTFITSLTQPSICRRFLSMTAQMLSSLEVAGLHDRLPDLPLLLLPVTHEAVDAVVLLVRPGGQRHADGDREALSERTG